MSIKKAILGLPAAIRLADCTEIHENEFEKRGIVFKRQPHYNGDTSIVSITNKSGAPMKIKEVVLFSGKLDVPEDTEFYAEGFRMLAQFHGKLNDPKIIGSYGSDVDFFPLPTSVFDNGKTLCNNVFNLLPVGKPYVLVGFASTNKYAGMFRFAGNYVECFMDTEDLVLYPNRTWEMEELAVLESDDNDELYTQFGHYINLNHPRLKYHEIPLGWCSYHCCRGVHIDVMGEQAKAMAERIPELERIQIDAGYSGGPYASSRGSRGSHNFLPDVCDRVRESGMEAAGYWNPFVVRPESRILTENPGWCVQNEDGTPWTTRGGRSVLDGTNPEARKYLRYYINWMHKTCGIRYFKLDFTEYGALPGGVRYDTTKTRIEAYRMAMEEMLRDVRSDSYILNCNAPFWPGIGMSHGNRTSNDIHRRWSSFKMNALEQFSRNWQHNVLWINDPDGVELTRTGKMSLNENGEKVYAEISALTDDEFEFHKAFIIACGGMVMSGDLLDEIPESGINVLKKMIAVRGEAAIFDYSATGGREFKIGRKNVSDGSKLICVFNWGDEETVVSVPVVSPKDKKCAGKYKITDFWSDELVGEHAAADKLEIKLAPHGARVLKLS